MKLSNEIMYNASFNKDASFEGIFWMGVKTTGIFCRPTCTARKPKLENVVFFDTTKDAILKGYRPCKVCKPLEKLNETPKYIQEIIDELVENPSLKFKDYDLGDPYRSNLMGNTMDVSRLSNRKLKPYIEKRKERQWEIF